MQLQPAPRGSERRSASPRLPAWERPLSTLLSAPSAPPLHQPAATGRSLSPENRGSRRSGGSTLTALRDRVASTRRLSETLKEECLERLDRIDMQIPQNQRHRPSWSHLHEPGPPHPPGTSNALGRSDARGISGSDFYEDVVAGGDFEPRMEAAVAAAKKPRSHTHGRRRKSQLWIVDDQTLTAAASVWRSTAKSPPRLLAVQSAPTLVAHDEDVQSCAVEVRAAAPPNSTLAVRGAASLLRTTLRRALEV